MSEQHEITLRLTREQANDYGMALMRAAVYLAPKPGYAEAVANLDALRTLLHEALYPEKCIQRKRRAMYHIEVPMPDRHATYNSHFPLQREEIVNLLTVARQNAHTFRILNDIQLRISQGVRGLVVPYEIDTPIAYRHSRIEYEYCQFCTELRCIIDDATEEELDDLIDKTAWKLYTLMND